MEQRWTSPDDCTLAGRTIRHTPGDYTGKTTAEEIIVLKPQGFFQSYEALFQRGASRNILEIGVFEGGSSILFADMLPDAKIVGIDIREPNPAVLSHIEQLGYADRVDIRYRTSQDDEPAISAILDEKFGSQPLDVVIDDASHLYDASKRSFEIAFPRLRNGGLYVIEDWAWAHWRGYEPHPIYKSGPTLSNLVLELAMASASTPDMIASVEVSNWAAIVTRGWKPAKTIRVDDLFTTNGRNWQRL